ncbi:mevalonate kinase family protein [Coxiella endosymbiont of Amblyomma sculptum]|uniref:mevalonate kinase family protein n=1 Tax=Coxiella endosymbiont of Amblyomma sculptum TaxID=2487929 RepID=UPI001FE46C69|nr:mevalonate kinase [Coxiella endosymbiont of Amblyomma sculptum]
MYKAKAPGNLILLGEYSVLYGKTALVTAISKSVSVTLKPRKDNQIFIDSNLGKLRINRHQIISQPPFEFVLEALALTNLPSGCDIEIDSDLPIALGLGSSAAVTVALLTVLNRWNKKPLTKINLWKESLQVIHRVQGGMGSGADCAASIFGGVIAFSISPLSVLSLKGTPPLVAIYSGKKLNTACAIGMINSRRRQCSDHFQKMDEKVHKLSMRAISAINTQNWTALGKLFNKGQDLMRIMGVSNIFLENLTKSLQEQPNILGAKISGSGFGDCIVGVGKLISNFFPRNTKEKKLGVKQIALSIISEGANCNET